jgi:hypothetical protein
VRPLTVLTGIVLGSAAATTFGLGATCIVFLVLAGDESAQFREELPLLAAYFAIFGVLTAVAALSFIGQARELPWRRWALSAMWATLLGLAALYRSTR